MHGAAVPKQMGMEVVRDFWTARFGLPAVLLNETCDVIIGHRLQEAVSADIEQMLLGRIAFRMNIPSPILQKFDISSYKTLKTGNVQSLAIVGSQGTSIAVRQVAFAHIYLHLTCR